MLELPILGNDPRLLLTPIFCLSRNLLNRVNLRDRLFSLLRILQFLVLFNDLVSLFYFLHVLVHLVCRELLFPNMLHEAQNVLVCDSILGNPQVLQRPAVLHDFGKYTHGLARERLWVVAHIQHFQSFVASLRLRIRPQASKDFAQV